VQIQDGAQAFRSRSGSILIINRNRHDIVYAEDGVHYYELQGGSGSYRGDDFEAVYADNRHDITYQVVREADVVTVNGRIHRPGELPTEIDFVALPTLRESTYLFVLPDGQVIYVSQDVHHFTYESFRFFIGPWDDLQETEITQALRYRDGGTTVIKTVLGTLFQPTPIEADKRATWTPVEGDPIELRRIENLGPYDFTETEAGVTMSRPVVLVG
jgi:hypothetical protein